MRNYYTELRHFHTYSHQIDALAKAIAGLTIEDADPFIFADIGSNDGELTQKIVQELAKKKKEVRVYASEPDSLPVARLRERFLGNNTMTADSLTFDAWMNKYGSSLNGCLNLILNSHTFYHYPQHSWEQLIERSSDFLTPNGKHVIILDGKDSTINQLQAILQEKLGNPGDRYGTVLLGCDLEHVLAKSQAPYEHHIIHQPIIIPNNDTALLNLTRMVGFIFRYETKEILQRASLELGAFLSKYSRTDGCTLPRTQDLFVVGRSNSS